MAIKLIKDGMSLSLSRIAKDLKSLPQDALKVWIENTPKRSGNARNKTKLNGDTIRAAYPYAEQLDKGYSKQKPQGMSSPTERFIKKELNRKIRK